MCVIGTPGQRLAQAGHSIIEVVNSSACVLNLNLRVHTYSIVLHAGPRTALNYYHNMMSPQIPFLDIYFFTTYVASAIDSNCCTGFSAFSSHTTLLYTLMTRPRI
jgi:hypothetical protein